jgi:5'-methylthioadenosine phosphorylase
MEGPAFSTRAESELYRAWGADIIGMTALPEAKLAREAQLCYVTLAMATDYDCWRAGEADVTVDAVVATLNRNSANAERLLASVLVEIAAREDCSCRHALDTAVITAADVIPPEVRERYAVLMNGPQEVRS